MSHSKKILSAVLSLMVSFPLMANAPLTGTWLTQKPEKNAKISITPCTHNTEKFCGKIVWLQAPTYEDGTPKIDKHNPDDSLKNRPLLGLAMLNDFEADGENKWSNGTIYNPEDGETYSCTITYEKEGDRESLNVRGYVGIELLGKTQTWIRAPKEPTKHKGKK